MKYHRSIERIVIGSLKNMGRDSPEEDGGAGAGAGAGGCEEGRGIDCQPGGGPSSSSSSISLLPIQISLSLSLCIRESYNVTETFVPNTQRPVLTQPMKF